MAVGSMPIVNIPIERACPTTTGSETTVAALPRPRSVHRTVAAIFLLNYLALANWIARIPDVKQLDLMLLCAAVAAVGALLAQIRTGLGPADHELVSWLVKYWWLGRGR